MNPPAFPNRPTQKSSLRKAAAFPLVEATFDRGSPAFPRTSKGKRLIPAQDSRSAREQFRPCRGFTILELLVVMGIIIIALVALVPAVTSLSKSGGRRAAFNILIGGIEQARAEAIKSAQATYVVFPTFTSGAQSTLDRYNYRAYAIFEDDAANPGNVKQLTDWKSFPAGAALRAAGTAALSNLADPTTLTPPVAFSFAPDASAAPFRCFKFNSNGEVQAPAASILLGVFEGYVNSGSEVATTKDANGNPSAVEYLTVSQFTGRAVPANAVSTPTPTPGP